MDKFCVRPALPKTTEEAERRYINNYTRSYNGPASEMSRLKSITQAFIAKLRKVAPKFYEEKLPTLINQACSKLLTFNTNTEKGAQEFHLTHALFLQILDSLQKSQPGGDVNFQDECERVQERSRLFKRQAEVQSRLSKLYGTPVELPEDSDDEDSEWSRVHSEIDSLKAEEERLAYKIAAIEGYNIEQEADFELIVKPGTNLSKLPREQLDALEKVILEYYKENNCDKIAMYMDCDIMSQLIAKAGVDLTDWAQVEQLELTKNALDAYKEYHRKKWQENFNQRQQALLEDKEIIPREGIILKDPDDIPEDVKQKLDLYDQRYKRMMEDMTDDYSKRHCQGETDKYEDPVGEEDDLNQNNTREILESLKKQNLYNRVKEEPRDDYDSDEAKSEESFTLDDQVADSLVDGKHYKDHEENKSATSAGDATVQNGGNMSVDQTDDGEKEPDVNDKNDDDDDDDDIECLGIIEPSDKVKTFDCE